MSNELVTMGMDKQIVVTEGQMAVIKSTIFPDSTDDELKLFIYNCQRKGVHPMDKLIHPIKRGGKVSFQASIDYLRSEAETTGEYNGQDEPVYEYDNPQTPDRPSLARVAIYRKGFDKPFIGIARWDEYYPGDTLGFMWKKMPHNQLAKCAEALGFRKAFPKKLGDLYIPEEMAQADNPKSAAQNKQAEKTASLKPANKQAHKNEDQAEDAILIDNGDLSLAERIDLALDMITGGDEAGKKNLLMEASRGGKTSGPFLVYTKLKNPETSQQWLENIYKYLEPKLAEMQGAEDMPS